MSASTLRIEPRGGDTAEVLEVHGEVDLTNAQLLAEALSRTDAAVVVLDLAGVSFIDSAGMRAIDDAHRQLAEAGRRLLVAAPEDSRAGWTFRVAGFAEGFLLDSVEVAERRAAASPT